MSEAFLLSAVRTLPETSAALPTVSRQCLDAAVQSSGANLARVEALLWGWDTPECDALDVPEIGQTAATRVQAGMLSSQQAVNLAAQIILAGDADLILAGGGGSEDGSLPAALLLASPAAVGRYNLAPRAGLVARVFSRSDPQSGPWVGLPAARMALHRAGLGPEEIDLLELAGPDAGMVSGWAEQLSIGAQKIRPAPHGQSTGGAASLVALLETLEARQARYGLRVAGTPEGVVCATLLERI